MSSREQFEAWACKHWPYLAQEIRYRRDALPADDPRYMNYCSYDLQAAWESWQASRQALVVELPAKISHLPHSQVGNGFVLPEAEQYDEAIDDCREAVEAAGVRVKP